MLVVLLNVELDVYEIVFESLVLTKQVLLILVVYLLFFV